MKEELDRIYRQDSRRIFATLIRSIGDFDQAEAALHDAFAAALAAWPREGLPANPVAWLISTARFKAIDAIRRRARFDGAVSAELALFESKRSVMADLDEARLKDDHLRLIFTCCHPALAPEAQVALTLREVCGLSTEEIAAAFLLPAPTIAQRILRGKAKIRDAKIPYSVPSPPELPERLDSVLAVAYLVFNEGYSASSGEALIRADLSGEAIRLCRVLLDLLPDSEVMGLLALMLLHDSRRAARATPEGDIIVLEDQDRSLWDRAKIDEGKSLVRRAFGSGDVGPYTLQAAISAAHAEAPSAAGTDWSKIAGLYDLLLRSAPSPVVELNRAVAIAMRDGPSAGLALIDDILVRGELESYHLIHAAKADLYRRLGRKPEARLAYEKALSLAKQAPERRYLAKRLEEIT